MIAAVPERSLDELTLGANVTLDELIDRQELSAMIESFYELFRVPLRVFSEETGLLAGTPAQEDIYDYLSQFPQGRRQVLRVIEEVKALRPEPGGSLQYVCFAGGSYLSTAITHDGRLIGRAVLGPFLTPDVTQVPRALLTIDEGVDAHQVKTLLARWPRAQQKTVLQIAKHLEKTLDLVLFNGHKALLVSSVHLASVRESFRQLEEKNRGLQQAYDRLKELDRLKNNFLATVSHELRTPLTSIIGYSEMLMEGIAGPISEQQHEFTSTIHDKGQQLLELISGLLDLSKMESGPLALRKADVDVRPLVLDVLQTLAPMARRKGVALRADIDSALPKLVGDPVRLRQVVLNLADNALKFTPAEGQVLITAEMTTLAVNPSAAPEGVVLLAAGQPALRLVVRDTGPGIADSEKERVFDPFYQIDSGSTRSAGGTGLGLSIVRRLVEGHQGKITVEDNQPHGAAFVVVIPFRHLTLS